MNQASRKVLDILKESERLADKVLQNKQEIVELDKRRQGTREAIRNLAKTTDKSAWITIGPILVKMEKEKANILLKKGKKVPFCSIQLNLIKWLYNFMSRGSFQFTSIKLNFFMINANVSSFV